MVTCAIVRWRIFNEEDRLCPLNRALTETTHFYSNLNIYFSLFSLCQRGFSILQHCIPWSLYPLRPWDDIVALTIELARFTSDGVTNTWSQKRYQCGVRGTRNSSPGHSSKRKVSRGIQASCSLSKLQSHADHPKALTDIDSAHAQPIVSFPPCTIAH